MNNETETDPANKPDLVSLYYQEHQKTWRENYRADLLHFARDMRRDLDTLIATLEEGNDPEPADAQVLQRGLHVFQQGLEVYVASRLASHNLTEMRETETRIP